MNNTNASWQSEASRRGVTAMATLALAALSACGGGGGDGGGGGGSASAPAQVTGTVANGQAVAQATITATDVNGTTATTTAHSDGTYSLAVSGLTAPIALVATDPSGQASPMIAVLPLLPTAGQTGVANVTTLTTAVAALLTPDGNAMDFVTKGSSMGLSGVSVVGAETAKATLNAYLANLLGAVGLPATYDPVATTFTANHTGTDALIDMLAIVPEGAKTYLIYKTPASGSTTTQSAAYLALNDNSTPANAPVAPAVSASTIANIESLQNFLGTLPAALQSCGAAGGTGSACSGLIDASYQDNGYTNITKYAPGLASSSLNMNGSTPTTVSVNQAGTSALVAVPYGLSSAQGSQGQYTLYTTVHQAASGSWNIVGNQLPYNMSVSTRTTYRSFHDSFVNASGNPDQSVFDAGVTLDIKLDGTGSAISYALVTGPGLPASGLWLTRSSVTGVNYLSIAVTQPTSAPTTAFTTGSNTNEFRWDWITPNGSAFTPPQRGYWATSKLDVSSLPASKTYAFTLYGANGSVIGTYNVESTTQFVDASLGKSTFMSGDWPSVNADVISGLLSASGAQAGAQSSVTVDFTRPPATSSLTLTGVSVQSEGQQGCGYQQASGVTPGTTSVTLTASGTNTCSTTAGNNQFLAINNSANEAYRIVQLQSKNPLGVLFYLNETYRSGTSAPDAD
ncbi:hypothetical protein [Paraburkholderia tagetis]|uniref:Carboxypeptidase regulatory-like domain-containing protein n=1 Tax=Paraburkholderia tagetis TaxID=2913261 RepID=A0A9X1RN82_9BURK|nr:hypothetical protein [Paraburkholderia tagetis]MCG5071824.1 hypothetical protein [Paraburkholderia tagetis]